ncbi:hypothetical protein RhiirA5_437469 [Rhizophagus irregularis]|uniref:Uncharacterized protein n=1 Tax=Rhizophagus irregularis TaxID=588596 RepID=A0A2N0NKE9_9GLOM|nr:hypothetical protein RhiirA5_437469 [Rhizophagus irregularis]
MKSALPWLFEPTEIETQFAAQIDEDIKAGNNTFGLPQVEGLFNKLDLNSENPPNMTLNMKESRLQLSSGSVDKEDIVNNLKKIRTHRTKKNCTIAEKDIGDKSIWRRSGKRNI